ALGGVAPAVAAGVEAHDLEVAPQHRRLLVPHAEVAGERMAHHEPRARPFDDVVELDAVGFDLHVLASVVSLKSFLAPCRARKSLYAAAMPSARPTRGDQPSAFSRPTSRSLRGVPSGLPVSNSSAPRKPTTEATVRASSAIVWSSPQPMLIRGKSFGP